MLPLHRVAASILGRWSDLRGREKLALGIAKRGDPMAPLGGVPGLVLLFSGKRKSGKDFVTEALQSRCPWGGEGGGPGDPESCDTKGVLGCDGVSFGVGVLRLQGRRSTGWPEVEDCHRQEKQQSTHTHLKEAGGL